MKKIFIFSLTFFKIETILTHIYKDTYPPSSVKVVSKLTEFQSQQSIRMANAVINTVSVEEPAQEIVIIKKKRSTLKKRLIITEDLGTVATPLHEEVITPQKSIWLQMRRTPKVVCPTIVWEGIEDISDDEDNSPQTAGRNLSKMKQTRDRIRHRQYAIKVDELQGAGLFLNWGKYFE